jgi:hypothetical protein
MCGKELISVLKGFLHQEIISIQDQIYKDVFYIRWFVLEVSCSLEHSHD